MGTIWRDKRQPHVLTRLVIGESDVSCSLGGIAHIALGQYPKAIQALTLYLKRVPEEPEGHLRLVVAIEAVGPLDMALRAYEYFVHYTAKDDSRRDWAVQKIASLRKQ